MADKDKLPWMPLDVAAYIKDTSHLTTHEHGAYMLLILKIWSEKGSIRNDQEFLRKVAKVSTSHWERTWSALKLYFSDAKTGKPITSRTKHLTQKRTLRELAKASEITGQKILAGKASAAAKALKNNKSNSTGVGRPLQQNRNAAPHTYIDTNTNKDSSSSVSRKGDASLDQIEAAIRAALPKDCTWPVAVDVNLSPVVTMISQGADLELDIVPVIRSLSAKMVAKGRKITNWGFFGNAVIDNLEKRKAGFKSLNGNGSVPVQQERNWDGIVERFKASGTWSEAAWGPRPGERGCEVPAEILKAHGI